MEDRARGESETKQKKHENLSVRRIDGAPDLRSREAR
jgi:hypothetical protein